MMAACEKCGCEQEWSENCKICVAYLPIQGRNALEMCGGKLAPLSEPQSAPVDAEKPKRRMMQGNSKFPQKSHFGGEEYYHGSNPHIEGSLCHVYGCVPVAADRRCVPGKQTQWARYFGAPRHEQGTQFTCKDCGGKWIVAHNAPAGSDAAMPPLCPGKPEPKPQEAQKSALSISHDQAVSIGQAVLEYCRDHASWTDASYGRAAYNAMRELPLSPRRVSRDELRDALYAWAQQSMTVEQVADMLGLEVDQ